VRIDCSMYSINVLDYRSTAMSTSPDSTLDPLDFVSFTARMMAAVRAQESDRPDRLFTDPFAAQLAGPEAIAAIHERLAPTDLAYVTVRTRFFDDFLQSQVSTVSQIVLLAAGMDTRAYRLPWPAETVIFELDQPGVLERKAALLQNSASTCAHHLIAADLTQPWGDRLLAHSFSPDRPSLWLVEGLLMYLTEPDVCRILETLSNLAWPGSRLGLDLISPASVNYAPYQGYFQWGVEEPEALLAEYGWTAIAHQPGDPAANYGRYTLHLPPRTVPNQQRAFLVTAQK
jgi:methyltransferase (TIGR00027 family)